MLSGQIAVTATTRTRIQETNEKKSTGGPPARGGAGAAVRRGSKAAGKKVRFPSPAFPGSGPRVCSQPAPRRTPLAIPWGLYAMAGGCPTNLLAALTDLMPPTADAVRKQRFLFQIPRGVERQRPQLAGRFQVAAVPRFLQQRWRHPQFGQLQ